MWQRAFQGTERLWRVFWLMYTLIGMAVGLVLTVLIMESVIPPVVYLVVLVAWVLMMSYLCWKNAFNVDSRAWGYVMRVFVVLGLISVAADVMLAAPLLSGMSTSTAEETSIPADDAAPTDEGNAPAADATSEDPEGIPDEAVTPQTDGNADDAQDSPDQADEPADADSDGDDK